MLRPTETGVNRSSGQDDVPNEQEKLNLRRGAGWLAPRLPALPALLTALCPSHRDSPRPRETENRLGYSDLSYIPYR